MFGDMLGGSGAALANCTRDLTADARAGRLEAVCCRADEISRVIDILLRQSKNNPALVGPAGVGKTAIAEGLAQRIARGDVPLVLRAARVLALDHVSLLAGTMYRGQYEERLRGIVAAASADPNIILFVDELHNLIGQGTAVGVAMDAANMLKPALVRGEFRVIGATTDEEYERWVCGDPALERRFQKIAVRELSADQTLDVLQARRERLARHHNVAIADEALVAAVRLTDLFITDRARPDRAIDALDEACAHAQAGASYSPATEQLVLERRQLVHAVNQASAEAPSMRTERAEAEGAEQSADSIDRWARDGFAALERFGAELEAAFTPVGADGSRPNARRSPAPTSQPSAAPMPSPAAPSTPAARLASVEWELQRRLIDEGLVVRGHDVARVVSLATGQSIQWTE